MVVHLFLKDMSGYRRSGPCVDDTGPTLLYDCGLYNTKILSDQGGFGTVCSYFECSNPLARGF